MDPDRKKSNLLQSYTCLISRSLVTWMKYTNSKNISINRGCVSSAVYKRNIWAISSAAVCTVSKIITAKAAWFEQMIKIIWEEKEPAGIMAAYWRPIWFAEQNTRVNFCRMNSVGELGS